MEANFGRLPHNIFYGLSLKRFFSFSSDGFLLVGFGGLNDNHPSFNLPVGLNGFAYNVGVGTSNRSRGSDWSFTTEVGLSAYRKPSEDLFKPLPFGRFGILYGEND